MSSSRLPGKTLKSFGEQSLLSHIVQRVTAAGFAKSEIVICTSHSSDDTAVVDAADSLGCKTFAGSLDNVANRILEAATTHGFDDFLLILGDNPWIDPGEIRCLREEVSQNDYCYDYAVTATPELAFMPEDALYRPIGTRIQYIRRQFMEYQLAQLESVDNTVREHVSRLFLSLPCGTRYRVLFAKDGVTKPQIGKLNISINTQDDYDRALAVLESLGDALSPTAKVVSAYLGS